MKAWINLGISNMIRPPVHLQFAMTISCLLGMKRAAWYTLLVLVKFLLLLFSSFPVILSVHLLFFHSVILSFRHYSVFVQYLEKMDIMKPNFVYTLL